MCKVTDCLLCESTRAGEYTVILESASHPHRLFPKGRADSSVTTQAPVMQPGPTSSPERRIANVSECTRTDQTVSTHARRVAGSSAPSVEVRFEAPLSSRPNRILSPTAHPTSPGKEPRSCLSDPRLVHPRSTTGPPRASASPSPSRAAFPSSTRALEEHSCGRRSVPRATRSPIREGSQSRIGQPASSRASPPASQAPPPRRRHLRERVKDRRTARQATRAQGSPARLPRTRARFVLHRC